MGLNQDESPDGPLQIKGDSGNIADVDAQGNFCVKVISSNDNKIKVTASDTTADYLDPTVLATEGSNTTNILETYVNTPAGDEKLELRVDQSKISITESQISDLAHYTHPNHTGEVTSTGDGTQVVDKTAISNQTSVAAAATDQILIGDASDTDNLKRVSAQSIADLGGGGGLWTDAGAHTYLTSTTDNVSVGSSSAPDTDFRMLIRNGPTKNGLIIKASDNAGTIPFRICDDDGTYIIVDVEADQGHWIFGATFANINATDTPYGIDNRMDGVTSDFNCHNGAYRVGGALPDSEVSATNEIILSSTTYALMTNMTITPGAGTYLAFFSCSGRAQSNLQQVNYALFSNGTIEQKSERDYGWDINDPANEDQRVAFHTQARITVADSQAIEVRYKTNISSVRFFERSLILLKVKAD